MQTLSANWVTEKLIDFEYKKYMLLAYLQQVSSKFDESKLYPELSDLVTHYRNLVLLRDSKNTMYEQFPERARSADFNNFKLVVEKIAEDDTIMHEIGSIVDYSIPQFEKQLNDGKKIYDYIEENVHVQPVGLVPLNPTEGYFFLKDGTNKETKVYEYQITIFENPDEKYRGIHTMYLTSYRHRISNTAEAIKSDLVKSNKKYPNPGAYIIETGMVLPVEETLLPIAKRALVKYVAKN